ncbi:hypothetical protein SSS_06974 [Sarcoptes scabiei]|uniref:Uncharacterized protein n=1 Tax=Sarcoptes scabiei TaxID=52283 RepID=A0A834R5T5_SARSC|nr:hypothetical protein SSS_06974 [Sarcoptes scabiei]
MYRTNQRSIDCQRNFLRNKNGPRLGKNYCVSNGTDVFKIFPNKIKEPNEKILLIFESDYQLFDLKRNNYFDILIDGMSTYDRVQIEWISSNIVAIHQLEDIFATIHRRATKISFTLIVNCRWILGTVWIDFEPKNCEQKCEQNLTDNDGIVKDMTTNTMTRSIEILDENHRTMADLIVYDPNNIEIFNERIMTAKIELLSLIDRFAKGISIESFTTLFHQWEQTYDDVLRFQMSEEFRYSFNQIKLMLCNELDDDGILDYDNDNDDDSNYISRSR